jgi:hypothetical protein
VLLLIVLCQLFDYFSRYLAYVIINFTLRASYIKMGQFLRVLNKTVRAKLIVSILLKRLLRLVLCKPTLN